MLRRIHIRAYYHCAESQVDWTFIHQKYNMIPWQRPWLTSGLALVLSFCLLILRFGCSERPRVFHFFNKKPWDLPRSAMLSQSLLDCVMTFALQRGVV